MNILERPDLMDRLAAAHALGTLRGGARRRFEVLARTSPSLRVMAQVWRERFTAITELQQAQAPDANVWKRIENLVAADSAPVAPRTAGAGAELLRRARNFWRASAATALLAGVAAFVFTLQLRDELTVSRSQLAQMQVQGRELARSNSTLLAQLQAQPEVRYVSVLHDDKATPTLLVMFDPKHSMLTLKRMANFQEGPDQSLQLWAITPSGVPRSLGVLGEQPVLRMAAAEQMMGQTPALAISLERKGGVPADSGPAGPVMWKGAVLQTPL